MRINWRILIIFGALFLIIKSVHPTPKNVLFLIADDMRPDIGVYKRNNEKHLNMYTPNLDKLALKSLLLKKAYVQQADCSPSRTSLLTGRRTDTTHVYDLIQY